VNYYYNMSKSKESCAIKYRRPLAILWVLLSITLLLFYLNIIDLPSQHKVLKNSAIAHERGFSHVIPIDHLPCDGTGTSQIELFQDGELLDPGHSRHEHIHSPSEGRHNHTNQLFSFSTSDNTDPRLNEREYKLKIPSNIPAWMFLCALVILGAFGTILFTVNRAWIKSRSKALLSGKPRSYLRYLKKLDNQPIPIVTGLLLSALAIFYIVNLQILLLTTDEKILSSEQIRSERGFAYITNIDITPRDGTGVSQLKLYEDGMELGPPHSRHQNIRDLGKGRHSHKKGSLRFSTSDNTDPRVNDREYKILIARTVPPYLWWITIVAVILFNLHRILRPTWKVHTILLVCIALFAARASLLQIDYSSSSSDALQYTRMAYNIFQYRTFSMSTGRGASLDHEEQVKGVPDYVEPTNYREPLLPAYLALVMYVTPGVDKNTRLADILEGELLVKLKYGQLALFVAIVLCIVLLVWQITSNPLLSYGAGIVGASGFTLARYTNTQLTELLAALLILLTSWMLYRIVLNNRLRDYALCSLALSLLVLTRGIYMYFIVFVFLILAIMVFARAFSNFRQFFTRIAIFIAIYTIIVGGWSIRNYVHFESFALTQRGGVVLMARANYNMMTREEYLGAFYIWSRYGGFINRKLSEWTGFTRQDLEHGGRLARLNRSRSNPDGYRMQARAKRNELRQRHAEAGAIDPFLEADLELSRLAKAKIRENFGRHILATLPFAWRGHFVDRGIVIPGIINTRHYPYLVSTLCWLAMFLLFFWSIAFRRWALLALMLLPFYSFGLYSFMTHNLPRYNFPVIPMLVVSTAIVLWLVFESAKCFLVKLNWFKRNSVALTAKE